MKILFLDIDGVLNSRKFFESQRAIRKSSSYEWKETDDIDPESVRHLNHLLKETGAKIVISSSWRVGKTVDELRDLAAIVGINSSLVIGKTTCAHVQGGRGAEIREWVKEHKDIDKFLILDDDDFDMEEMIDFMIKTDSTVETIWERLIR